ncbi:glycosyltransferase family 4 protein [bacterium]|nr:glycosyltransferase family 4 protein [bacterium]
MIKILYIDTHNTFGGGQTMLLRLLEALDKSNFFPMVICSENNQKLIQNLKNLSIEFIPIKTKILVLENKIFKAILQLPNFIKMNIKIAQIIKKNNPDIIHVNLFYSALFSIIPAKLHKKPFIWIIQTLSDLLRYKTLTKFLIRLSDKTILTCRDFTRMAKENGFDTRKLKVIYTGLKIDEFQLKESPDYEIEINRMKIKKPIIAMVGRFDRHQKGHQYFIEAAKIINKKMPEVNFLIVGGTVGEEEKKFKRELQEKVEELELSEKVIFTGFYPDLIYLLSNVAIVVIPSLYEAPSAVAMEASVLKRPVIASNVGGIPEVVIDGETGFLVPPKDPQAIAEKVIFLLKNPQIAKEMGEKGYQKVKENFTQERLARNYEKLYEELIKKYESRN